MPEVAEALLCPSCRTGELEQEGDQLVCRSCERRFPIIGGIPRLIDSLTADVEQVQHVFDFEHRRFKDSWYTRFEPRLVDQFLGECGLPRDFFRGKRALDAGCGSGRWSYALAELGAEVVGCDLTVGGLESARANLPQDNVRLYQADLFRLPFAPESFDFVMSWGVLHHTPDTRAAFGQLVPLVRPGGTLFVMVYKRSAPVQLFFTNVMRTVFRRLPDEKRYAACRHLVIQSPAAYRALAPFLMVSRYDPEKPELDRKTLQFGLFDAYSPRYNHVHTVDEVQGWFDEAGFTDVTAIEASSQAVRVRGIRPRASAA